MLPTSNCSVSRACAYFIILARIQTAINPVHTCMYNLNGVFQLLEICLDLEHHTSCHFVIDLYLLNLINSRYCKFLLVWSLLGIIYIAFLILLLPPTFLNMHVNPYLHAKIGFNFCSLKKLLIFGSTVVYIRERAEKCQPST